MSCLTPLTSKSIYEVSNSQSGRTADRREVVDGDSLVGENRCASKKACKRERKKVD